MATNYKWAEKQMLPCPFCGSCDIQVLPQKPPPGVVDIGYWMVRCINCPARMMVLTNHQRQLVAEWNHRQPAG